MSTKTNKISSSSSKPEKYVRRYFLPHARLNRGQRKYCHCLMKARLNAHNAYAACQSMRSRIARYAKTKKERRQLTFNPALTNCIMSYDFDDYSLEEVQALAREKNIDTHYYTNAKGNTKGSTKSKTKKQKQKKPYSKNKLVEKLTQYYISGNNPASKIRKSTKNKNANKSQTKKKKTQKK